MNYINTENAPQAIGPYSQAIAAGGFLFCSGQIPIDPTTQQLIGGDIEMQSVRVMENIKAVLEAAGTSLDKVVKATVFLSDMNNFAKVNAIYAKYFTGKPARSAVEVSRLPKDVLLEIECIAVLD